MDLSVQMDAKSAQLKMKLKRDLRLLMHKRVQTEQQ